MNEAETRAELIDPKLAASGWGVVEGSKVLREFHITAGKIQMGGTRAIYQQKMAALDALKNPSSIKHSAVSCNKAML